MHEKPFEKVQQKYFYSIFKCTVAFKLKILNLQLFSKNALLYVLILPYFELSNSVLLLSIFVTLHNS